MAIDIIVHGPYGQEWHVYGDQAGAEGVHLAQNQVEGLFEAPVRQAWDASARQIGGSLKGQWRDVRDISLGFHVLPTDLDDVGAVEDAFRQSFVFREDEWDANSVLPRIEVIENDGESRFLDVQLYEQVDFNPGTDFHVTQAANPILPLRAGNPNYYSDTVITSWSTAGTSGSGTIEVSNPGPLPMYAKWVLTRGRWTVPDVSWSGPPGARVKGVDKRTQRNDAGRTVLTPLLTSSHGGAVIDLEALTSKVLMIRSLDGSNLLGQMPTPGQYWTHEFPSYLQKTTLPISVSAAPSGAGARAELRQPRLWDRPIGGRLLS